MITRRQFNTGLAATAAAGAIGLGLKKDPPLLFGASELVAIGLPGDGEFTAFGAMMHAEPLLNVAMRRAEEFHGIRIKHRHTTSEFQPDRQAYVVVMTGTAVPA